MIVDPSKKAFLTTWPGGYRENWAVYEKRTKIAESVVETKCLAPFYNPEHVVLEIGCGLGFWIDKYLSPNFRWVGALDLLLTRPKFTGRNVCYLEVPDRNYECFGVVTDSIDFVWSFGLFCHLSLPAIQQYLKSVFRVLRPGGKASLFFSNSDRQPGATLSNTEDEIIWVDNDLPRTLAMMEAAGFVNVVDLIPELCDTIVGAKKPI